MGCRQLCVNSGSIVTGSGNSASWAPGTGRVAPVNDVSTDRLCRTKRCAARVIRVPATLRQLWDNSGATLRQGPSATFTGSAGGEVTSLYAWRHDRRGHQRSGSVSTSATGGATSSSGSSIDSSLKASGLMSQARSRVAHEGAQGSDGRRPIRPRRPSWHTSRSEAMATGCAIGIRNDGSAPGRSEEGSTRLGSPPRWRLRRTEVSGWTRARQLRRLGNGLRVGQRHGST